MQWMGAWQQGKYYAAGAFVTDNRWSMVAKTVTLDKPAPVPDPDDPASNGLPDPWLGVTTQSNISTLASGQNYNFSQDGWVKELRVYVTDVSTTTKYRVVAVNFSNPDAPVSLVFEDPPLVANQWTRVAFLNSGFFAGEDLAVRLEASNSAAVNNISGGWQYGGPSQGGAPLPKMWTQDNQRSFFNIDKFDLDGTDRSTELEGVTPESAIQVVETTNIGNTVTYRVHTTTDNGTYMTYGVILQGETGVIAKDSTCSLSIDVPIPLSTAYAEEPDSWNTLPSWANSVEGFLSFDGTAESGVNNNGYGIDILFEPARLSPDWDIVSFSE